MKKHSTYFDPGELINPRKSRAKRPIDTLYSFHTIYYASDLLIEEILLNEPDITFICFAGEAVGTIYQGQPIIFSEGHFCSGSDMEIYDVPAGRRTKLSDIFYLNEQLFWNIAREYKKEWTIIREPSL